MDDTPLVCFYTEKKSCAGASEELAFSTCKATQVARVVLCASKGAATHAHAIFKFLIIATQSSGSTSREPTVGRRQHKTKGTKPLAQAGTNLK